MTLKEITRFKQFCNKEGILDKFFSNYMNKIEDGERIDDYLRRINRVNAFLGSFSWTESKEGVDFWLNVEDKWQLLIEDENNSSSSR